MKLHTLFIPGAGLLAALVALGASSPAPTPPAYATVEATVGGTVAPDGKTEIQIDLPGFLHQKNIASKGLGCCVFRSIDHAARWANEPALIGMPEWMVAKGIAGGGYPSKVSDLIPKICKDRGFPEVPILQVEGGDLEIIKQATKNGIMPCVTYSMSHIPGRYNGKISHMVNAPHCDDSYVAILDNNYPGSLNYEWLSVRTEFPKTYTGMGGGWSVFILRHGPPPAPSN